MQDWLKTINELLRGTEDERRDARTIVWLRTTDYIMHHRKLPLGPLGDDPEERRNLATKVLEKLERNDHEHIREWERRQRQGRNAASWLGFVRMVACRMAIDRTRTSKRNIARRGEPCVWVQEQTVADLPERETPPLAAGFLSERDVAKLVEFLERLNGVLAAPVEAPEALEAPEAVEAPEALEAPTPPVSPLRPPGK
jgi:hypothetical protein